MSSLQTLSHEDPQPYSLSFHLYLSSTTFSFHNRFSDRFLAFASQVLSSYFRNQRRVIYFHDRTRSPVHSFSRLTLSLFFLPLSFTKFQSLLRDLVHIYQPLRRHHTTGSLTHCSSSFLAGVCPQSIHAAPHSRRVWLFSPIYSNHSQYRCAFCQRHISCWWRSRRPSDSRTRVVQVHLSLSSRSTS